MEKKKKYLIVAAAGEGSRMENLIPKQYLNIEGKPIIVWTLEAFKTFVELRNTIIVISKSHLPYWEEILKFYPEYKDCKIAFGGPTRFHSIKSAIGLLNSDGLVAIHDAARPMVSATTIKNGFYNCMNKSNAIATINLKDSVREISSSSNKAINREKLRLIQTPQIFHIKSIKSAYKQNYNEMFTDDASVIEAMGEEINLYLGNDENIKITTSADLKIASFILPSFYPSTHRE